MQRWSVIQLPAKPRQVASLEGSQRTPGPASKRAAATCCQPQPTPEDPGPKTTRAFRDSSVQKTGKEKSSFKVLLCSALATFVAPNWICAVWSWASHLRPPLPSPPPALPTVSCFQTAASCLIVFAFNWKSRGKLRLDQTQHLPILPLHNKKAFG